MIKDVMLTADKEEVLLCRTGKGKVSHVAKWGSGVSRT